MNALREAIYESAAIESLKLKLRRTLQMLLAVQLHGWRSAWSWSGTGPAALRKTGMRTNTSGGGSWPGSSPRRCHCSSSRCPTGAAATPSTACIASSIHSFYLGGSFAWWFWHYAPWGLLPTGSCLAVIASFLFGAEADLGDDSATCAALMLPQPAGWAARFRATASVRRYPHPARA